MQDPCCEDADNSLKQEWVGLSGVFCVACAVDVMKVHCTRGTYAQQL